MVSTITVGSHEIPLAAYFKILDLFKDGLTADAIIERVMKHTSPSALQATTEIVHQILFNRRCMDRGQSTTSSASASVGSQEHVANPVAAETPKEATGTFPNKSSLHRRSLNRPRERPKSIEHMQSRRVSRSSSSSKSGPAKRLAPDPARRISKYSPLQRLERMATQQHRRGRSVQ